MTSPPPLPHTHPFQPHGFIQGHAVQEAPRTILVAAPDPSAERDGNGLALPPLEYRSYGETLERHLDRGRGEADHLRAMLDRNGIDIGGFGRVLEFGCATCRVLRHFHAEASAGDAEFWGCDINAPLVLWSMVNLSPPFRFFANTTTPHLSFREDSFDFVFALSILTHIDAMTFSWINELSRVIRPGGYLFFTILDEATVEAVAEGGQYFDVRARQRVVELADQFRSGELRAMFLNSHDKGGLAFFRRDLILHYLAPFFEVIDMEPGFMVCQTGILVRRRAIG